MKNWMKWVLIVLIILVIAGFLFWKFVLPTWLLDGPGMVNEDEIVSISCNSERTGHSIKVVRNDQDQIEVTVRNIHPEDGVALNRVFIVDKDVFKDITEILDKYDLKGITNDDREEVSIEVDEIKSIITIEYRYSPSVAINMKYQYNQQEKEGYTELIRYLFFLDEGFGVPYTDNRDPHLDYKLNSLEDVSISLSSITSKGCTCTFTNLSNKKYIYGEYYIIYKLDESGQWIGLEYIIPNVGFNAIAFTLNIGESTEKDYNWEWMYGSLPKGRYLFIVSINPEGNRETSYLSQEFEIS